METKNFNVLVLAYLGDSIYEIYVRENLVLRGIANVNDLQKESIKYVSAKAQAEKLKILIENNFFTNEELEIIKRGRNYKSGKHPKNCDIITYKYATALETIIGHWYLVGENDRIKAVMDFILDNK